LDFHTLSFWLCTYYENLVVLSQSLLTGCTQGRPFKVLFKVWLDYKVCKDAFECVLLSDKKKQKKGL